MNKKKISIFVACLAVAIMLISATGRTEQASSDGIYNPRDEVLYGYRAKLEREDTRNQQKQLQQYQQQQYLEQQRLIDQRNMYDQAHQKKMAPGS